MAGRVFHDLALVDDRDFNPGADPDKPAMVEPSFWERLKSVFTGSDPAPATTAEPPQQIASTPETLREAVIDRMIDNVSVDQINTSNMIKVTAYSVSAEKPSDSTKSSRRWRCLPRWRSGKTTTRNRQTTPHKGERS